MWSPRETLAAFQSRGQLRDVAQSVNGTVATLGTVGLVRVFACDFCGTLDRVRAIALSRSPRKLTASEEAQYVSAGG